MTVTTGGHGWAPRRLLKRPEANPVLVKELRGRFRGARAFLIVTAFLMVLGGLALLIYHLQIQNQYYRGYGNARVAAEIGRSLFAVVAFLEAFLLAFIAPALTMNSVSGEVERQTYELLLATPLSGWAILRGKVGGALAFVLLLIFSSLPVMSLAFLFGGVSALSVVVAQLTALAYGLLFLVIGVFYSSLFKRTARAAVASYVTIATSWLLLPFVMVVTDAAAWRSQHQLRQVLVQFSAQVSSLMVTAAGVTDMYSTSSSDGMVFWAQAVLLVTALAGLLYLAAGSCIRRVGPGAAASTLLLLGLLAVWYEWMASTGTPFFP